MTAHEAACAEALDRLRRRTKRVIKCSARGFVCDMADRARLARAARWSPPLSSRQSQWLLELVLLHARSLRNVQLVDDARALLRRQHAA